MVLPLHSIHFCQQPDIKAGPETSVQATECFCRSLNPSVYLQVWGVCICYCTAQVDAEFSDPKSRFIEDYICLGFLATPMVGRTLTQKLRLGCFNHQPQTGGSCAEMVNSCLDFPWVICNQSWVVKAAKEALGHILILISCVPWAWRDWMDISICSCSYMYI